MGLGEYSLTDFYLEENKINLSLGEIKNAEDRSVVYNLVDTLDNTFWGKLVDHFLGFEDFDGLEKVASK